MRARGASLLRRVAITSSGLVLAAGLAACGGAAGGGGGNAAEYPSDTVEIMVPAAAGGGWDSTGRAMQAVIESENLIQESVEVFNVEGGGGATGLAQLQDSEGDPHHLMMTGLVMIGALKAADSPVSLENTTPIATLTAEAEAFVVPAGSPFQTITDVVEAYQADPASVTFGGGSAGGSDQLVVATLLQEAGADVGAMKYVGYSGGGEATAGILAGDVEVGVSGYSEFEAQIEAGEMRLLAISTAETFEVNGKPATTLQDAGYDVDFANWRAVVAAPGLSEEQAAAVTAMIDEMHATEAWKQQLEKNNWTDFYKTGDEAVAFFQAEKKRVDEIYAELGL
ncbi:MAG TPA: tripartite tricarboxylate transporter substrate binding protein [Pseudonocardia sp.]|nr:tripartite tricarboxylate transporter substrate binding protein [Pseudonocardia sp.]